jgi:hypothetical protein
VSEVQRRSSQPNARSRPSHQPPITAGVPVPPPAPHHPHPHPAQLYSAASVSASAAASHVGSAEVAASSNAAPQYLLHSESEEREGHALQRSTHSFAGGVGEMEDSLAHTHTPSDRR